MLTQDDLQAIQKLVKVEGANIKDELDASLDRKLKPIRTDIRKIKRNVDTMIDMFDRSDVRLQKRVKKIEEHLGLQVV